MKNIRWLAVIAAMIIVAPILAEARVGSGTVRKPRQQDRPGARADADRSQHQARGAERDAAAAGEDRDDGPCDCRAASGGFMSRNPFLSGLMGGMLGAGLIGMMFGGGFAGGLGGGAGMLGLLLQLR